MSSMESFYGGRQGASFVIVKRFDGIDIPQTQENPIYRVGWYAKDQDGYFIVVVDGTKHNLIERTGNNYITTFQRENVSRETMTITIEMNGKRYRGKVEEI